MFPIFTLSQPNLLIRVSYTNKLEISLLEVTLREEANQDYQQYM